MQWAEGDLIYTLGHLNLPALTEIHNRLAPGLIPEGVIKEWWRNPRAGSLLLVHGHWGPWGRYYSPPATTTSG